MKYSEVIIRLNIRRETPADYEEIYAMVKKSFAKAVYSDGTEADYLDNLRTKATFIPELSLLAAEDDIIIGQIVLSKTAVKLQNERLIELVISPLSVHPNYFRRGIATALVEAGLKRA